MDYEHDIAFEFYHSDKSFTSDICSRITIALEEDNTKVEASPTEVEHTEATAEANAKNWMKYDLSISFKEAKHLVRQEHLSTMPGSTSKKDLNELAEEVNTTTS